MNKPLTPQERAGLSGGFSGGGEYYEFAVRGFEAAITGRSVLDLGCGTGGFGYTLYSRFTARQLSGCRVRKSS